MFNTLYSNIKANVSVSSAKFLLSILIFGISLGLGTNKLFGYLVNRYTEPRFTEVTSYETLNDRKMLEDEKETDAKITGLKQEVQGLDSSIATLTNTVAQLSGTLAALSNQLEAVSKQTYENYKLSRKLVIQKQPPHNNNR